MCVHDRANDPNRVEPAAVISIEENRREPSAIRVVNHLGLEPRLSSGPPANGDRSAAERRRGGIIVQEPPISLLERLLRPQVRREHEIHRRLPDESPTNQSDIPPMEVVRGRDEAA